MVLSNPLHGERRPGFVGTPVPGIDVRLVDEQGTLVPEGTPGEIEVRGPAVFLEYWQRPDDTRAAFRDGWFRTGDVAIADGGAYRLLGRTAIDIIKTGGYKISALEIEDVLRTHPAIAECAVVGVADEEWGERVAAAVELRPATTLSLEELQEWARMRLAPYKVPRAVRVVHALPRNAVGKILKPEVAPLFAVSNDSGGSQCRHLGRRETEISH
jgi:malonyl-CoA/methylmalonyl-CoA synthetase